MNHDLTVGEPKRVLLRFTLPLFGSILLQQMYNIADSLIAGKLVGKNALAAISDSYEVTLVYLAFAFGCNVGCSVLISQLFGAKAYQKVKSAVTTTFLSVGALCLLLTVAGFLFGKPLLVAIDTPAGLLADAMTYLNIYTLGLFPLFFYNIATGIFSAIGDSVTPFRFLAISSVSNILLDILFVAAFDLGVAGVAWATFLCQTVSCLLSLYVLRKRLGALDSEKAPLFSGALFKKLVTLSVPSVLQQSFVSVGNILIQKAINGYFPTEELSTAIMAGYGAAVKLNNLTVNCFMTVGNGVSNFVGQNIGAKRIDRVKKGYHAALGMGGCLYAGFALLYLLAGGFLIGLFVEGSASDAVRIGKAFLTVVSPFYFVVGLKLLSDGVLRGAGCMKYFMFTTFVDLIIRVCLAYVLPLVLHTDDGAGIWLSWPVGWAVSASLSFLFYKRNVWQRRSLV